MMKTQTTNKTSLWLNEFGPRFEVPAEITDHPLLTDTSWHNDASPSFKVSGASVRLWADHPNAEQREMGGERFAVVVYEDADCSIAKETVYEGDDVQEAIAAAMLHSAIEMARQPITTLEGARAWFGPLSCAIAWHPDDGLMQIVDVKTGKPTFDEPTAKMMDQCLTNCIALCEAAGLDTCAVALEVQEKLGLIPKDESVTSPVTEPVTTPVTEVVTGHTPGPWVVWQLAPDSDPEQRTIVTTEDGETEICGVVENEANARLIAAAPELLSALQRLLELCENGEGADYVGQEQARSAIRKAGGAK